MAQINSCVKRTFIGFNLLFAIIGGIIIGFTVVCQILTSAEQQEEDVEGRFAGRFAGLTGLYIMGGTTMLLGLLGAYGAYKEHKVSLIMFLVCMVIGAFVMIRAGIPAAVVRPQLDRNLEEKFRELLPLNTASFRVKELADTLQSQLHCCGLFSYSDWNDDIPASCLCSPEEETDECRMIGYNFLERSMSIYRKPCVPILAHYVRVLADITLGVIFTMASLAVLGMVLSSIMIHQLRRPNRAAVLYSIPAIFTPGPPKYQELHNDPPPY